MMMPLPGMNWPSKATAAQELGKPQLLAVRAGQPLERSRPEKGVRKE